MLDITRFSIQNIELRPWIKFIWHLESQSAAMVNNKLLPTDSIDVIINLSDPMEYKFGDWKVTAPALHFNGMHNKYGFITQKGKLDVFGISFYPFGFYPFIHIPLSRFKNQIGDLKFASSLLYEKLLHAVTPTERVEETVRSIEEALCSVLNLEVADREILPVLQAFYCSSQTISVKDFCLGNQIGQKTFERACLKYAGFGPKTLQRLSRFQTSSNQLIYSQEEVNLTDLACRNDYYDQAHFIKEFKDFSGAPPGRFTKDHNTIKENTKYTYK